jgi:hypothetical protein
MSAGARTSVAESFPNFGIARPVDLLDVLSIFFRAVATELVASMRDFPFRLSVFVNGLHGIFERCLGHGRSR